MVALPVRQTHDPMSLEAFFAFTDLPEHRERHFELIGGEVYEVVSRGMPSTIAAMIAHFLIDFAMIRHKLGRVSGADAGFLVNGEAYIPDAAYLSYARQVQPVEERGYNVLAPDLAVEVLSPGNTPTEIATKVTNYLIAGTVVWLANPVDESVTVYLPGQAPTRLTVADTLTGSDVLPGFGVSVRDLFPVLPDDDAQNA